MYRERTGDSGYFLMLSTRRWIVLGIVIRTLIGDKSKKKHYLIITGPSWPGSTKEKSETV